MQDYIPFVETVDEEDDMIELRQRSPLSRSNSVSVSVGGYQPLNTEEEHDDHPPILALPPRTAVDLTPPSPICKQP